MQFHIKGGKILYHTLFKNAIKSLYESFVDKHKHDVIVLTVTTTK